LKAGDKIEVRSRSKTTEYFKNLDEIARDAATQPVGWLKSNPKKMTVDIIGLPTREEAEPDINEQLIVEYYSR